MRKITDFIIDKRHIILVLFIILTVVSVIVSKNVNINDDITKYLPSTSETRKGMDIMESEFEDIKSSSLNVMFEGLEDSKKGETLEYLKNIEGVSSVDYDETENYNKDNYTLYVINVDDFDDSELASNIYNEITNHFKDSKIYTSGAIADANTEIIPMWIMALAVICIYIILTIMCESYVEPILFLLTILMAILLNKGSNIMFSSVSSITDSITAILQMALSMDYSIMLIDRYRQEKEKDSNNVSAMKRALYNAFTAISSSSLTTIVGLLTLVFMSFTLGRDMGLVLAKGVLCSLICVFFVLPTLILMCDKLITKTRKKVPNIRLDKVGKGSYKVRYVATSLFVIIFIGSYLLKGNQDILYTDSQQNQVAEVFKENNQIAIIYKNEDEKAIASKLNKIEETDKVEEVLAYGNTINEELTYNELNPKIKELMDSDLNIEEYLIKILYYNYYNPDENNTMTFTEFIDFIKSDVYNNPKMGDKLDEGTRKDIDRLENFTKTNLINEQRTVSELASVLEIDKEKVDDIFIYYMSKNNDTRISLGEFINFMNKDVLTNEIYAKSIDNTARESLNTLSKFTDKNTITKKMTSNEIANLFGMDESTINSLYTYYISVNDIDTKLSISEFSNFVLTDVLTNPQYANIFNEETVNSIKMLNAFSNKDIITYNMNSSELANLFGMDENIVKQLLLLKYSATDNGTELSLPDFINTTLYIKNNTSYLEGIDLSSLEKLSMFAQNQNNINTTKMDKKGLSAIFDNISNGLVDTVYAVANLPAEYPMTPQEFINMVLNNFSSFLDVNTVNSLNLLKMVIDDSVSTSPNMYTATEMAKILGIPSNQMYQLYGLIDFSQNNTNNWVMTPNEFVTFILENSSNPNIQNSLDESTANKLKLVSGIMASTINDIKYSYEELAQLIGIDSNTIKSIYSLYVSKNTATKLTPQEFVTFVLNHKNDEMLAGSINTSTASQLTLLQKVMNGTINNKKYNSVELSNLLGMNESDLKLLYGLYTIKYVNTNPTLSLKEMVTFLLDDVMNNPDFSSNFDKDATSTLKTINGIMNNTISNTKYTKNEMFAILSDLAGGLDKNTVDLLYLYYGSSKEYNENWTLTVEKLVNFLNNDILKDSRFDDFIDDDMRNSLTNAKDSINDAKKLLIGNGYSRIIINTKLEPESEETFNFIQGIKDNLGNGTSEFYVIGDSPMAYEMSQTFQDELNFITILTMVAIFVVVALTFKSIIVPLILVLIIQCAVYTTMGIISVSGEGVHFIALLVVQSILMGATIDYAILYTTYYIEHRKTMEIKEAVIASYNKSINTILTSSSILIIVTFAVGKLGTGIPAKICMTLSQGTLCAALLILIFLPAILATCDKLVAKKKI